MRRSATPPTESFPAPRGIDRISDLPVLRLTSREFEKLPEYSCSKPTGVKHGKRWRRHDGAHDPSCPFRSRAWMIGEYKVIEEHADGTVTYQTHWYRPIIVLPAVARRPFDWRKELLAQLLILAEVGHLEHVGTQILDGIYANLMIEAMKPKYRENNYGGVGISYRRETWSPALDRVVFTVEFTPLVADVVAGKAGPKPLQIHFGVAPQREKVA